MTRLPESQILRKLAQFRRDLAILERHTHQPLPVPPCDCPPDCTEGPILAATGTGTTSAGVTLPATDVDSLLLAWVVLVGTSTAPSVPSGWTASSNLNGGTGTRRQRLYWKVRAASEPDPTWSHASATGMSVIVVGVGTRDLGTGQQGGHGYTFTGTGNPGNPFTRAFSSQTNPTTLDVLNVWGTGVPTLADSPTPDRTDAGFTQLATVTVGSDVQTVWHRPAVPRIDTAVTLSGGTIYGQSIAAPCWENCP